MRLALSAPLTVHSLCCCPQTPAVKRVKLNRSCGPEPESEPEPHGSYRTGGVDFADWPIEWYKGKGWVGFRAGAINTTDSLQINSCRAWMTFFKMHFERRFFLSATITTIIGIRGDIAKIITVNSHSECQWLGMAKIGCWQIKFSTSHSNRWNYLNFCTYPV